MARPVRKTGAFRRAVLMSVVFHVALVTLIALSPSLPGSSRKALIRYIPLSLGGLPGGGGGGGGASLKAPADKLVETPKPSLRDLTLPEKIKPEPPRSDLRYPTDKPKREPKAKTQKKASISAPSETAKTGPDAAGGQAEGAGGSGIRIGVGGPGGGGGSGFDSQIGLSSFPYTYYLQAVMDRVSANWFTSLVDPGVRGHYQSVVYFRIQRNGRITDLGVKESSGIESLDLSALRAVQRSTPFPPLPADYGEDYLGIFLIFEHSK
jgi:TonB family protein